MTTRDEALARLNTLRVERNLPPHDGTYDNGGMAVKITIKRIEQLIHELDTAIDAPAPAEPVNTQLLLKRLNAARESHKMPPLKKWKGDRETLVQCIERLERTPPPGTPVTKGPTKVAKGANVTKFETALHKSPPMPPADDPAGEPHPTPAPTKKRASSSTFLTPGDIATALSIDPRKLRVFLRKHESDIPNDYRDTTQGRWAFITSHRQWVLDWVKKGIKP